ARPAAVAPRSHERRSVRRAPRREAPGLGAPAAPDGGSAARGPREEDDAVGVRRDLAVALHEQGLAPGAVRLGGGHGGPHALVELAAKLLDEALLVLAHARIALRETDLAVTRFHAQEPDF